MVRYLGATSHSTRISSRTCSGTWLAHQRCTRATFVTTPTRRAFNTPENQVLAFALFSIAEFGKRTGWHQGASTGPARDIHDRVAEATRWLQARQFVGVRKLPPTPTTMSRVRTGRARLRYRKALEVVELYQRYIARLDREAIRDAVEHRALIASRDSVLLELHCAFDTIRSLRRLGWKTSPSGILWPPVIFRGHRDGSTLEVRYQRTPSALSGQVQGRGVRRRRVILRLRDLGGQCRWCCLLFCRGVVGEPRFAEDVEPEVAA